MPDIGWPELIIILFVLMLLFGAKKLPDMARGTGRALRIFKAETKGLIDDNSDVAEKAEPQYGRQPLQGDVQGTNYQQPQGYQPPPAQPQQPPAQPYVDPVQRTNDR